MGLRLPRSRLTMGKLTVTYREDVVAALDDAGGPLRAEVRDVLRRPKGGGVLNLASAWAGKRVVVIELPPERRVRQ